MLRLVQTMAMSNAHPLACEFLVHTHAATSSGTRVEDFVASLELGTGKAFLWRSSGETWFPQTRSPLGPPTVPVCDRHLIQEPDRLLCRIRCKGIYLPILHNILLSQWLPMFVAFSEKLLTKRAFDFTAFRMLSKDYLRFLLGAESCQRRNGIESIGSRWAQCRDQQVERQRCHRVTRPSNARHQSHPNGDIQFCSRPGRSVYSVPEQRSSPHRT